MVSNGEIKKQLKNKRMGKLDDINCRKCGFRGNPVGSKFCQECGATLLLDVKSNFKEVNKIDSRYKGSFWRRIPGFRSHTIWKEVISSIIYLIIVLTIIALVSAGFSNSMPSFQVATGAPITIIGNNTSTDNGMMINATLHDTGSNINVLPVEVYAQGNHIGNFFVTNVTSNQNTGFKLDIINDSEITIQNLNYDNLNFYPDENSNNSSYSLNPGDYKFIIGNQNLNITSNVVNDILQSLVTSYNQTKNSSSDSIPIQGPVVGEYSSSEALSLDSDNPTNFPLNTNLTIVMPMDTGNTLQGQWTDQSTGMTVNGYQSYLDVVVIYWPEMKIAGWHRITGPPIPDTIDEGSDSDIYGDPVSDSSVEQWINSQTTT